MNRIRYTFFSCRINRGTQDCPDYADVYLEKSLPYSEANEAIAKGEALDGAYTIEDDGLEESAQRTTAQRLTQLEEALDALKNTLEGKLWQ